MLILYKIYDKLTATDKSIVIIPKKELIQTQIHLLKIELSLLIYSTLDNANPLNSNSFLKRAKLTKESLQKQNKTVYYKFQFPNLKHFLN